MVKGQLDNSFYNNKLNIIGGMDTHPNVPFGTGGNLFVRVVPVLGSFV